MSEGKEPLPSALCPQPRRQGNHPSLCPLPRVLARPHGWALRNGRPALPSSYQDVNYVSPPELEDRSPFHLLSVSLGVEHRGAAAEILLTGAHPQRPAARAEPLPGCQNQVPPQRGQGCILPPGARLAPGDSSRVLPSSEASYSLTTPAGGPFRQARLRRPRVSMPGFVHTRVMCLEPDGLHPVFFEPASPLRPKAHSPSPFALLLINI